MDSIRGEKPTANEAASKVMTFNMLCMVLHGFLLRGLVQQIYIGEAGRKLHNGLQ